jgi:DNA-binding PadR family transcriptional regulator
MSPRDPQDLLPLTPPVFSVLLTLGTRAMHGYAMMQELERRTEGREILLPGSLYATIARMLEDGLIQEVPAPKSEETTDKRRRFYKVTELGRAVARAEVTPLDRLLELAREQKLIRSRS